MIIETLSMVGRGLIWQSALLTAIVFLVLHLLPRGQISARYRVALSGLFGAGFLLILPFLPAISFGVDMTPEILQPASTVSPITAPSAVSPQTFSTSVTAAPETHSTFPLGIIFAIIWLAGSLVALSRLGFAAWQGRSLLRGFRPVHINGAALSRPATIMRSADISAPLVFGLLKPTIVVPETFSLDLNNAETRVILEHEIAHIVRGDLWVNLGQRIVLGVLWWCLPLYWINRQIGAERENLCDAMATAQIKQAHPNTDNPARMLAGALVRFAEQRKHMDTPVLAIGIHPHANLLARRIQLLCDNNPVPQLSKKILLSTSLAVPVTLLMLSMVTPRALAGHPPDKFSLQGEPEITTHNERADVTPLQWGLYMAVQNGDKKTVQTLMQTNSVSPNYAIPGDGTPLIEAVRSGDKVMLDLLIAGGADVNLTSSGDGSPLIVAAQLGDIAMIDHLINKGAKVNLASGGDGNPLIAAALSGRVKTAKSLLDHGADVNAQVQGDETPLINAAQQGHLEMVELLVRRGADVNLGMWADSIEGRVWRTASGQAQKNGHSDVTKYLRTQGARAQKTPKPAQHASIVQGRLTSSYGLTRAKFGNKVHTGIDIANRSGTPIYAPAGGVVIEATDTYKKGTKWGKVVVIETDGGVQTVFAHLKDYNVAVGQTVKAGEQIARVGNTGKSTGPHVHIETLIDGYHVDPVTVWPGLKALKKKL